MAYFQSDQVKLGQVIQPFAAGVVQIARFEFTFSTILDFDADVLEIGILPAYCRPLGGWLSAANFTNVLDVGLMSGDLGDQDDSRTVGDEFIDGVAASTYQLLGNGADWVNIEPVGYHRGIGVIATAADITAAANKLLQIGLYYTAEA